MKLFLVFILFSSLLGCISRADYDSDEAYEAAIQRSNAGWQSFSQQMQQQNYQNQQLYQQRRTTNCTSHTDAAGYTHTSCD